VTRSFDTPLVTDILSVKDQNVPTPPDWIL
jgi:hypothetical protein